MKKKYLMGSLLRVAIDVDIRIINSETSIRCMAEYYYIPERKKKGNNNGHHQAFRNGYDILKILKEEETSTTPSCSGPIPAQKSRGNSVLGAVFSHTMLKMDFLFFPVF